MAGGIGQGTPLHMPSTGELIVVVICAAALGIMLWWFVRKR